MSIREVAPTIDALMAMGADEVGLRMLPLLERPRRFGGDLGLRCFLDENFHDVFSVNTGTTRRETPYPGREHDAAIAIIEAWMWLEGQGLLVPAVDRDLHPHPSNRVVSRRGKQLAADPQHALTTRLLPKENLHALIREDVWASFHRGKYDTAVFEAMKAVEVRVREAAGLPAKDIGTSLVRKAFDPTSGVLTDHAAEPAEREARSALFAGAIGSYKNPQSHRKVALDDPDEAAEIIMLACHLLRIVDARAAVRDSL